MGGPFHPQRPPVPRVPLARLLAPVVVLLLMVAYTVGFLVGRFG
jgi:hypothetical protein